MDLVPDSLRAHQFPVVSRIELSQSDMLEDDRHNHRLVLSCRPVDSLDHRRLIIEFVGVQKLRLIQSEFSEIAVGQLSLTDVSSWQWTSVRYQVDEAETKWLSLLCWDFKVFIDAGDHGEDTGAVTR